MSLSQVAVIGSANLTDPKVTQMAFDIGYLLASSGYNLVCGGLQGVMKESCRGFKSIQTSGKTVGILPGYDFTDANEFIDIIIPTGLDIGRNQLVVSSGFAVIVIGGGAGTLSEIALASQINKPILFMKGSGGWSDKFKQEYLDSRQNSRLYYSDCPHELIKKIINLNQLPDKSGAICSNHNR